MILLIEYVINNSLLGSALEIIPPTSSSDEPVVQQIQLIEEAHAKFYQWCCYMSQYYSDIYSPLPADSAAGPPAPPATDTFSSLLVTFSNLCTNWAKSDVDILTVCCCWSRVSLLVDVLKWERCHKLEIVLWSGQSDCAKLFTCVSQTYSIQWNQKWSPNSMNCWKKILGS